MHPSPKQILTALLLATGILIPGIRAVSALQEGPPPTVPYVVRPGDTLWEIAGTLDAERDIRAVIDDLMELNDLRSPSLWPGQQLRLPAE